MLTIFSTKIITFWTRNLWKALQKNLGRRCKSALTWAALTTAAPKSRQMRRIVFMVRREGALQTVCHSSPLHPLYIGTSFHPQMALIQLSTRVLITWLEFIFSCVPVSDIFDNYKSAKLIFFKLWPEDRGRPSWVNILYINSYILRSKC